IANQVSDALVALFVVAQTLADFLLSLLPRPLRENVITVSTAVLAGPARVVSFFKSAVDALQATVASAVGLCRRVHADVVQLRAFITAALRSVNNAAHECLELLANILELCRLCLLGSGLHWIVVLLRVFVPHEQHDTLNASGLHPQSGRLHEALVQQATAGHAVAEASCETATHEPEAASDVSVAASGSTDADDSQTSGSILDDADEAAGSEDGFSEVIPESDDETSVKHGEKLAIIRILQARVSELEAASRHLQAELDESNAQRQFLGAHIQRLEVAASVSQEVAGVNGSLELEDIIYLDNSGSRSGQHSEMATHCNEQDMDMAAIGGVLPLPASIDAEEFSSKIEAQSGSEHNTTEFSQSPTPSGSSRGPCIECLLVQRQMEEMRAEFGECVTELERQNAELTLDCSALLERIAFLAVITRHSTAAKAVRDNALLIVASKKVLRHLREVPDSQPSLNVRASLDDIVVHASAFVRAEVTSALSSKDAKLASGCTTLQVAGDVHIALEALSVLGDRGCTELGIDASLRDVLSAGSPGQLGQFVGPFVETAKLEGNWGFLEQVLALFGEEQCAGAWVDLTEQGLDELREQRTA
ncbi:hypothetical protein HDU84_007883, partial [Entophlyctis sp. JEL0112]